MARRTDARFRGSGATRRRSDRRPARARVAGAAVAILVLMVVIDVAGSSTSTASSTARRSGTGYRSLDPALFAKGACVALPPTRGNRHRTVFLDAGHGGRDPGSVGTTRSGKEIYEADLTLPVELDAAQMLRRRGFRVVVSRTADTSVAKLKADDIAGSELSAQGVHDDVAARDVCANHGHANILIGIYFDAGAPSNAGSVTGYDAARQFAAKNLRLAHLVQADVLDAMNARGWNIPSEGVQPDGQLGSAISGRAISYGHLLLLGPASPGWFETPSRMPGALIEPLFITDPFEGSIADSATGQQVIAAGLTQAVEQYFAKRRSR